MDANTSLREKPRMETGEITPGTEGAKRAGDFLVGYAVRAPEGYYSFEHSKTTWHEPEKEKVHLAILPRDAETNHVVPELTMHASLLDAQGGRVAAKALEFFWDARGGHYGADVAVPKSGAYVLQVHVYPPTFNRMGKDNDTRYIQGADVTFENVMIES